MLTIQKAIELLTDFPIEIITPRDHDNFAAILLGIEALKRVQLYKNSHIYLHYTPLPGEIKS